MYGDTDSVFVVLKGKTKDEAFDIGEEMARVITQQNPKPMKLKFEKVIYEVFVLNLGVADFDFNF